MVRLVTAMALVAAWPLWLFELLVAEVGASGWACEQFAMILLVEVLMFVVE